MYDVIMICRFIINYCNEKHYSITNLRLQKILYFLQLYFIEMRGERCFINSMEAWDLGPVSPDAYAKYRVYGASEIPSINNKPSKDSSIQPEDQDLIRAVLDKLSKYSTWQLVDITHNQMPWKANYTPYVRNTIPPQDLVNYVKKIKNE